MPSACLISHLPAASGSGVCLSSPGPAAPLGGGQACAWVAVSLEAPIFLCTSALSPVSPVPRWSTQL